MYSTSRSNRTMGLAVTSAMSAVLLAGCATQGAPRADLSAGKAQAALAKGKTGQAIENAEAAVQAEPRNAAYRAMLGAAYLEAGRFASATTSFDDAMALGDNSTRTALSLALALTGEGKYGEAGALLNDWQDAIAPADLGLAYSLAGQPQRGIQVLSNAIRSGDNTPKMRQNLAYSYALNGQWREARLMAAEDVSGDQIGDRMQEWAILVQPEAWQHRVAALIGAPAGVQDAGQPVQLALANTPSVEQFATEAAAYAAPEASAAPAPIDLTPVALAPTPRELAPVAEAPAVAAESDRAEAVARPDDFQTAFATIAPSGGSLAAIVQDAIRFVQEPVVQTVAVRQVTTPPPARSDPVMKTDGTHLVQLGSFASEQSARRAWGIYLKKYPSLASHEMVITEALVRGKRYWRVSAAGYDKASSNAMCGRVKGTGEGCFAYAEGRPLPGAIDTGVRLARR